MLSEYKGSSNSSELLQHLVGEKITGAMIDRGYFVIILESGCSLILTTPCGHGDVSVPSFWNEFEDETKRRVDNRLRDIEEKTAQVKQVTALQSALGDEVPPQA